ncbi:uncharacterized protein LOC131037996 [Cryptomeria japonica]|uniref:uncharacterized protein LOC131037996 n=1 Tax=Cryptomeria japonica TaxID=3369 RepID=UPI0027DA92B1|nr:uncharacterized protein LOC131037996 [Cryptomeria japonica]
MEEMAAIGGEASSNPRPPFLGSGSSGSASVSIGPHIHKNKSTLDSLIVPCTTLGAQPLLESMGWNQEKHDATKMAIGDFWFYNNVPFHAVRYPYSQIMVDDITGCGQRFKAPNDEEIKGPILNQKVVDVKAKIAEQCEIWRRKGCTIVTDGWIDRRSRTLLIFLVSSLGNCTL